MKKRLNNIREFFWPLLDKENASEESESDEPIESSPPPILIIDDNLEKALDLTTSMAEAEEDRRKGIESKASLFLTTISVASTLIIAANLFAAGTNKLSTAAICSVTISFVIAVYAARTVWFSVKTLERGKYSVLDFDDINVNKDKNNYYRYVMGKLEQIVTKNESVINNKVNYLTMAQEYYKRAIVAICLYAGIILMFALFDQKQNPAATVSPVILNQYINIKGHTDTIKKTKVLAPIIQGIKAQDTIINK